jgi:hypothetical protein
LFFDVEVPDELKVIFIEYIHRHLEKYAKFVRRDRRYICPNIQCGKLVTDFETVRERLAAKKKFVYCQRCDKKVPLVDFIEKRLASDPVAHRVLGMEEAARQELDTRALEQILIGHLTAIAAEANQMFRSLSGRDDGIDGEIAFRDRDGRAGGRRVYIQFRDSAELRSTRFDASGGFIAIFDIRNRQYLDYWLTHMDDIYVVTRDSNSAICWMNLTQYLRDRPDKWSRQISFRGERVDAAAVWRVWDQFFPAPRAKYV